MDPQYTLSIELRAVLTSWYFICVQVRASVSTAETFPHRSFGSVYIKSGTSDANVCHKTSRANPLRKLQVVARAAKDGCRGACMFGLGHLTRRRQIYRMVSGGRAVMVGRRDMVVRRPGGGGETVRGACLPKSA